MRDFKKRHHVNTTARSSSNYVLKELHPTRSNSSMTCLSKGRSRSCTPGFNSRASSSNQDRFFGFPLEPAYQDRTPVRNNSRVYIKAHSAIKQRGWLHCTSSFEELLYIYPEKTLTAGDSGRTWQEVAVCQVTRFDSWHSRSLLADNFFVRPLPGSLLPPEVANNYGFHELRVSCSR